MSWWDSFFSAAKSAINQATKTIEQTGAALEKGIGGFIQEVQEEIKNSSSQQNSTKRESRFSYIKPAEKKTSPSTTELKQGSRGSFIKPSKITSPSTVELKQSSRFNYIKSEERKSSPILTIEKKPAPEQEPGIKKSSEIKESTILEGWIGNKISSSPKHRTKAPAKPEPKPETKAEPKQEIKIPSEQKRLIEEALKTKPKSQIVNSYTNQLEGQATTDKDVLKAIGKPPKVIKNIKDLITYAPVLAKADEAYKKFQEEKKLFPLTYAFAETVEKFKPQKVDNPVAFLQRTAVQAGADIIGIAPLALDLGRDILFNKEPDKALDIAANQVATGLVETLTAPIKLIDPRTSWETKADATGDILAFLAPTKIKAARVKAGIKSPLPKILIGKEITLKRIGDNYIGIPKPKIKLEKPDNAIKESKEIEPFRKAEKSLSKEILIDHQEGVGIIKRGDKITWAGVDINSPVIIEHPKEPILKSRRKITSPTIKPDIIPFSDHQAIIKNRLTNSLETIVQPVKKYLPEDQTKPLRIINLDKKTATFRSFKAGLHQEVKISPNRIASIKIDFSKFIPDVLIEGVDKRGRAFRYYRSRLSREIKLMDAAQNFGLYYKASKEGFNLNIKPILKLEPEFRIFKKADFSGKTSKGPKNFLKDKISFLENFLKDDSHQRLLGGGTFKLEPEFFKETKTKQGSGEGLLLRTKTRQRARTILLEKPKTKERAKAVLLEEPKAKLKAKKIAIEKSRSPRLKVSRKGKRSRIYILPEFTKLAEVEPIKIGIQEFKTSEKEKIKIQVQEKEKINNQQERSIIRKVMEPVLVSSKKSTEEPVTSSETIIEQTKIQPVISKMDIPLSDLRTLHKKKRPKDFLNIGMDLRSGQKKRKSAKEFKVIDISKLV